MTKAIKAMRKKSIMKKVSFIAIIKPRNTSVFQIQIAHVRNTGKFRTKKQAEVLQKANK